MIWQDLNGFWAAGPTATVLVLNGGGSPTPGLDPVQDAAEPNRKPLKPPRLTGTASNRAENRTGGTGPDGPYEPSVRTYEIGKLDQTTKPRVGG